jgi:hypothetical protein
MIHGFLSIDVLDVSKTALDEAAAELRSALGEAAPA